MDINPFDQFGAELGGALPKQSANAAPEPTPHDYGSGTFDLAPKQQQARKPVMNVMNNANPPAGAQQQGPRPGNYGAYGTAPGGYQQWGQPPAQQPPQQQPPPPMGSYYNALVPSAHQSNPYALGGPPVQMPPSQMQPTQMHPPMMQPQMMHPQMHQNGAMGMSKSPPPNMMAPTPPNMMAPAPVAWGAPPSHHPPAPAHQPETGFDDMFGTSSVASGSGSVKAPGSLPPTSPPRSFQAPSQPAPAPPVGGGFDDIFGGGLAPVAPCEFQLYFYTSLNLHMVTNSSSFQLQLGSHPKAHLLHTEDLYKIVPPWTMFLVLHPQFLEFLHLLPLLMILVAYSMLRRVWRQLAFRRLRMTHGALQNH